MVETIGYYEILYKISSERLQEFEAQGQLIEELKLQIKHLQKSNYTLKSLLLSKLPSYLNAIIESL